MSQKQKTKDIKRSKKKKSHENYLKRLFSRYGHSLVLNSNREAPGNKHWSEISVMGTLND
jgi:hypothetical protein